MSKLLKRSALVELLSATKGGRFISLTTRTFPKLRKSGNPLFGKVCRIARRNGQIGVNYENAVNNQLEREGKLSEFESYPLPWGTHHNAYFVSHKGNYYLKYKPTKVMDDLWLNTDTNEEIPLETLQPFLPQKSESRQDTDKEVQWRTIAVESISQIAVDGEVYELVG